METTTKPRPTVSKPELDVAVDRARRRLKGWVLAHNHIVHASMDEVEQIVARMKRRSLRMSAALGLAIGFASATIAIYLGTTIRLLMGYVRP
jgi:hypothetical protein